MILANARARLTASDVELVLDLLSDGEVGRREALSRQAMEEGIDVLLDAPELLERLVRARALATPSGALFLYVAVRHTLRSAGIDDAQLGDYLTALLLDFGVRDRAHRIAAHDDEEYRYLADVLVDLGREATGRREFLLQAHLGNYSLWLAGVFPDYIAARRERKGGPDLRYYEALGTQGFRAARDHRLAAQFDLVEVFDRASESFGRLRVALNRLSDRFLFPHWSTPDRLLRQVVDDAIEPL